ncbi:hypothetical protein QBC47DRAFT_436550 [Echria macrotheca]|uniref:Uncharacterized protein n=1 Tax=Echria macrotheca TaxID=438768 RepID=A0AAJ0FD70_9PEZI|nr:hypothetical protein QBC47DRAFT_436550 [Echria macrotheca]
MDSFLSVVIAVALGAQRSLAATQYVPDNTSLVIASSVSPCSLIGDPDLYGLGVRIAFYVSFGTCLIAIVFGLYDELKTPRLSFNILLATLLIILARNVQQGSFAIFEWYLVTGLAIVSGSASLFRLASEDDDDDNDDDDEAISKAQQEPGNEPDQRESGSNNNSGDDNIIPAGTRPDHPMAEGGAESTRDQGGNTTEDSQDHDIERNSIITRAERKQAFIEEYAFERHRMFLTGPISFGFSYLLYGILSLMQPWLYFTHMDSGHRAGCPVPFVFFGTFDMYNIHWQRWLKAQAVIGVIGSLFCFVIAVLFILGGSSTRSYRAAALEELNKKMDQKIMKAEAEHRALRAELQKEKEEERRQKKAEAEARKAKTTEQLKIEEKHARKAEGKVQEDGPKLQKLKKRQTQIKNTVDKLGKSRLTQQLWGRRGILIVWLVVINGFLPIYFIERTISLNRVDLGSGLADSSGQMLALLVAVFTSFAFAWQVFGNYVDGKKRREDFKNRLVKMDDTIVGLTSALEKSIEVNTKRVRDFRIKQSVQQSVDTVYRGFLSNFSRPSDSEPREYSRLWRFSRPTERPAEGPTQTPMERPTENR